MADNKLKLKIKYTDFWPGFDPRANLFNRLLRQRFDIELSDDPDFVIYSGFGNEHRNHDVIRIFYTGESRLPDFRFCDYAFSSVYFDHPDHYRWPNFALRRYYPDLVRPPASNEAFYRALLAEKSKFCSFVYSNPRCRKRNRFFKRLSRYRKVDSGGAWLNNLGSRVGDKYAFQRPYKFAIAFENRSRPGYTTEKITDAMRADSVPIYWGDPLVGRDFNSQSFLNLHDFDNDDALIERIIELDRDDDLYLDLLTRPWLPGNALPERFTEQALLDQFERIFTTDRVPVAIRRRRRLYRDLAAHQLERKWRASVTEVRRFIRRE